MLPDGACREDIREKRKFYDQALKHGVSWYEYANVTCSRMAENGSLYLVTGTDKTTSWGITAFSSSSGAREVVVKLTADQVASGSVSRSHHWEINSPDIVRTGSSAEVPQQDIDYNRDSAGIISAARGAFAAVLALVSPTPCPVNQCVFARGYCISLRDSIFDALTSGHKVSLDDHETILHRSKSSMKHIPFNTKRKWPWKEDNGKRDGHIGTSIGTAPRDETQEEDVIADQIPIFNGVCHRIFLPLCCGLKPFCNQVYNPAKIVNRWLLDTVCDLLLLLASRILNFS